MQETSNEKQVATKKSSLPSSILFEADAGAGLQNIKSDSVALPILKLLQNGSGEAKKLNPNYMPGAEPGMFLNTVTKKLYDGTKGVNVIPCHYKLEYQEWSDFGTGQGRPENIYQNGSDILTKTTPDQMGKDRLPNGNYILTVGQHYVLVVDGDSVETALISMSASQGKVSRKWQSLQMSQTMTDANGTYTPASFSHIYNLSTVLNSGKGNQWYGYAVKTVGPITDASLYGRAKEFHLSLSK